MKAVTKVLRRWQSLPAADTPLIRWGIVIIALIAAWGVIMAPYLNWREHEQTMIAMQAGKAVRIMALKSSAVQWQEAKQAHDKASESMVGLLFSGSSYAASQAALLDLVSGSFKQFHLTLDSQRMMDAEPAPGVGQQVAVYFRARGAMADALRFIDALGRSPKLLLLDKLYIGKDRNGQALLQFQASGYRLTRQ